MIDLRPDFLDTLKRLLAEIVPDCEVRIFGSRYNWTATDASDLDLALVGPGKLHWKTLTRLKAALEESSLPYRVDVLDWRAISPEFQKVIEQGYEVIQKPELGMGAEGWKKYKLGDIVDDVAMGPFGSNIKVDNFISEGVPVIRGSNLNDGGLEDESFVFISEEKANSLRRSLAYPDDLVFTHRGTIGQVGIIPHGKHPKYLVSQSQMRLSVSKEYLDPKFLYYFFKTATGQYELLKNSSQVGVPAIASPTRALKEVEINLPPLSTQRRIADILSVLDEKIELNRQTNATLEAIAQAIFKEWFVDFNFPGATGEMVESDLGMIPRGWEVKPLPEVIEVNPSRALRKGEIALYLDMANVPTQGHRGIEWVDRPFGSGTRFINGDTLLARITPCLENGKTAFVDFLADGQTGWGSTEYIVLHPKAPLPPEYGYYLARSDALRNHAIRNMIGTSGRQRTPASSLDSFLMVVPEEVVAKQFGVIAASIISQIRACDEESRTLAALRDALLPKLMNGIIPVGANDYSPLQTTQQPPPQPVLRRQPTPQPSKVSGR